jgi:methanogenic corrinoid protein MtbC1
MCCAVEGDFHELPTFLAQVVFENEGWEAMNFGANTPLDCLAKEILKHQPDTICISATFIENIVRFSDDYKDFSKRIEKIQTSVIFGGKAFADISTRELFPNAIFVKSFNDLADWSASGSLATSRFSAM